MTNERQSIIAELAEQINFGIAILALLFFLATILMPCCLRKPKRAVYVRGKEPEPKPAEQAAPEQAERASPEQAERASPEQAEQAAQS